ncbi:MAG: enoyl-CoA hydratase-related protein [Oscillospiraceae bacterium]|nr:enoyl-CoA hydratase-related protein [Oscillospiraceae bacterium]
MGKVSLSWKAHETITRAIAIITMNRPEQLNALNAEVLRDLDAVLDEVAGTRDCRVAILTGAGEKSFVAGADIKEMETMSSEEAEAFSKAGNDVLYKLQGLRIPVIAAVNGYALGGGCELALACDIRLAATEALFAMPETSLGIFPGFGATQRLPRLVGFALAAELVFTGRRIRADRALEIGLVNAVIPRENLMDEALKMAGEIAAKAPIAIQHAKHVMHVGLDLPLSAGLDLEAVEFGKLFATSDAKGGLQAFSKKEKYQYEGK